MSKFLTGRPSWRKGIEQHKNWVPRAVKKAKQLVAEYEQQLKIPTLVVSSSSPFSAHIAAAIISAEMGVHWIADYRDLWSLNHSNGFKVGQSRLDFEREVISGATKIVTVSEQLKQQQSELFSGDIRVIHNGFVKRNLRPKAKAELPIKIVYTGSLYKDYMNLGLFLSALEEFQLGAGEHFYEVIFAGSICADVTDYYVSKKRKVPSYISLLGELSRKHSYELQQEADIGLVFGWEDKEFSGSFPTKFFEYLGSNLYVLFSGGHAADECAREIKKGQLGTVAHTANSLISFFDSFSKAPCSIMENSFSEKYSYSHIAKSFELEILDVLNSCK